MCQQRTALDMIKANQDHGGLSDAALLLHQKQCEDTENMNKRIDEIENKVDIIDHKVDEIKHMISQRVSLFSNIKEILSNKVFLYLLLVLICVRYGISIAEVGTFLFK